MSLSIAVIQCPVCQTEYFQGTINFCATCGWNVTPDSLVEQVLAAISPKELLRLTWAREMWSWTSEMHLQLQLQSKLSEIEDQMQQAKSERTQIQSQLEQLKQGRLFLQSQLSEVLSLIEPLRQLQLSDPEKLQLQLLQIETQLRQAQQERSQDVVTQLSQLLRSQLSDVQSQLQQQAEHQQKQLESLLSDLRSSIPGAEKVEVEKVERQPKPQNELISAVGVDYTRLQELLAAGEWKEADRETVTVTLKAAGQERKGLFRPEDIANFPCTDLRTIDQLWVKYSQNRFGFSVQKRIWLNIEGSPNFNYETYCRFGTSVGWYVKYSWLSYFRLTFSLDAPVGHLPGWRCWGRNQWGVRLGWFLLSNRNL